MTIMNWCLLGIFIAIVILTITSVFSIKIKKLNILNYWCRNINTSCVQ